ncbi:putative phage infection (PIP) family protein YhgE [Anaerosolibacter carboniphilus]|uniref:Putative phage infection (PIP) family protein YhgE n=1 Tax=Anaerosolibacter carboniphilus TaxID=1417629 RepID=A0A841L2W8_9FIRM|nr:phage scaffolding protein [Anaerosolibacter carboniphilus]MBB6217492.1 putative phage infection (PIP) family protein YhgE [Anaerosolibacter carboniphilus]
MEQLKGLLGEEIYHQVKEKAGDRKLMFDDENFIPKSRFNKVIQKKNAYKDQVKLLNDKLTEIQKIVQDNEELVKNLQEINEKLSQQNEKIKEKCFLNAIHLQATKMNGKNMDAVSRLIDKKSLIMLEDGTIMGLEEQLKSLRESKPFLFAEDTLSYLGKIHDYVESLMHTRMIEKL